MVAVMLTRQLSTLGCRRAGAGRPWQSRRVTSVSGARVLVTGASGGLGSRIARLLSDRGAQLTLVGRNAARLAALELPGSGSNRAQLLTLDLRDPGAAQAAVDAAVAAHGGLDGVVHAAGVVAFGSLTDLDDAVLLELFDTNVFAPIRLIRSAHHYLQESAIAGRSPFVVNLSAVVAEQPMAGMAAYTASKAALTAFDAAAGRELRRARIRLIDARPPHTETGLATRPIGGVPPSLPPGLDPEAVAQRVLAAIDSDERDLPSAAFA